MLDYRELERKFQQMLGGERRPVAITFLDAPPQGVAKFQGAEPSSCSFWRIAAAGSTFYTVASDHWNCPIGGYTHNTLTAERMPELQQTLALMGEIGYVRSEDIPGVFHRQKPTSVVLYAPLAETPVEPSVVIATGRPGRVMLLCEAAMRAGAMSSLPLLARPTCMAIPAAMENGTVASSGCIGNRVYTELADDQMYLTLRGSDLERIARELDTILAANATLTAYHQERRRTLTAV